MPKTSVIGTLINPSGKSFQKTITDINPNVSNDKLVGFVTRLNNLTQNTYVSTTRIDKTNCDSESSAVDTRPTPTLAVSNGASLENIPQAGVAASGFEPEGFVALDYDGDGVVYVESAPTGVIAGIVADENTIFLYAVIEAGMQSGTEISGNIIVRSTETENYKAAAALSVPVSVTIE